MRRGGTDTGAPGWTPPPDGWSPKTQEVVPTGPTERLTPTNEHRQSTSKCTFSREYFRRLPRGRWGDYGFDSLKPPRGGSRHDVPTGLRFTRIAETHT